MSNSADSLRYTLQLSDPIWGAFLLTDVEEKILQTPELTRLEHIKQMGLAFLDYPSLTHTRLEHSLGVMYVADRIFRTLRQTTSAHPDFEPHEVERLFSSENQQAVRLAALLHDLGHPPFSHAVELTFLRYPSLLARARDKCEEAKRDLFEKYSHETFTRWIISNSDDLMSILRDRFGSEPAVAEIADLAVGKARGHLSAFNTIISGDFDADRIDYLIRDNRHSGFAIGLSPDELYGAVHLRRHVDTKKKYRCYEIYIDRNALPFVNSVLSARERLINRVHLAPAGRAATQMLARFLFEDLSSIVDGGELAKTIIRLHRRCTDFTFFDVVVEHLKKKPEQGRRDISALMTLPSKTSVWKEFGHVGFIHMHPCLRLLAYIGASARYDKPQELVFQRDGEPALFLEPSSRPAPKFSLIVDYKCDPLAPGLDYIGSTENRQGRAILAQSLSNLDLFAYELDAGRLSKAAKKTQRSRKLGEEYTEGLSDKQVLLVSYVAELADRVKRKRISEGKGLMPSEFILAALYFLDLHVASNFPGARSVYVYRSEYFINHFLRSLVQKGEDLLPVEFRGHGHRTLDGNRVFSEVQRLNVFGLIETRVRAMFHAPLATTGKYIRRTRKGVHGTREDFRIGQWGKHYVETEIQQDLLTGIRELVDRKQNKVCDQLRTMAEVYPLERLSTSTDPTSSRAAALRNFEEQAHEIAERIWKGGGCVMIFRLPQPHAAGRSAVEPVLGVGNEGAAKRRLGSRGR